MSEDTRAERVPEAGTPGGRAIWWSSYDWERQWLEPEERRADADDLDGTEVHGQEELQFETGRFVDSGETLAARRERMFVWATHGQPRLVGPIGPITQYLVTTVT